MARKAGNTTDAVALENALRDHPEAFEFFEAARRLECAFPERPRLGHSAKAVDDFVRLCQTPSLAFAPKTVDRYEPGGGGKPARLHGLFFGLFGPNAPLPLHLTEYAIDRELNAKDRTFTAFANIFHHRMMSLFYRAWADSQPTVQIDRPAEDRFRMYMGALVGLATPDLGDRDALPDQFKRFFAGRLLQQSRNAEGLKGLLERFFRVPVSVVEFVTEWMRLPPAPICDWGHPAKSPHWGYRGHRRICIGQPAAIPSAAGAIEPRRIQQFPARWRGAQAIGGGRQDLCGRRKGLGRAAGAETDRSAGHPTGEERPNGADDLDGAARS